MVAEFVCLCARVCVCVFNIRYYFLKGIGTNTDFPFFLFFFPRVRFSLALTVPRLKEIFLSNKDLFLREKLVLQVQFMFI